MKWFFCRQAPAAPRLQPNHTAPVTAPDCLIRAIFARTHEVNSFFSRQGAWCGSSAASGTSSPSSASFSLSWYQACTFARNSMPESGLDCVAQYHYLAVTVLFARTRQVKSFFCRQGAWCGSSAASGTSSPSSSAKRFQGFCLQFNPRIWP